MADRRKFLHQIALSSTFALSIPHIVEAAIPTSNAEKIKLNKEDIILFQGDSITDAGRNKEKEEANDTQSLGSGYAGLAAAQLLLTHANLRLKCYNKGISGNKVYQLTERWEEDTLRLKPTVLSILIGVNDFWHTLAKESPYEGTIADYKNDLTKLLEKTKERLPDTKLIIGEPFAVKNVKAVNDDWYPKFDAYRMAAKEIATQFGAGFIPYQKVFDEAQRQAPAPYWTGDGVHTTLAGAALMAAAWLKVVE